MVMGKDNKIGKYVMTSLAFLTVLTMGLGFMGFKKDVDKAQGFMGASYAEFYTLHHEGTEKVAALGELTQTAKVKDVIAANKAKLDTAWATYNTLPASTQNSLTLTQVETGSVGAGVSLAIGVVLGLEATDTAGIAAATASGDVATAMATTIGEVKTILETKIVAGTVLLESLKDLDQDATIASVISEKNRDLKDAKAAYTGILTTYIAMMLVFGIIPLIRGTRKIVSDCCKSESAQ